MNDITPRKRPLNPGAAPPNQMKNTSGVSVREPTPVLLEQPESQALPVAPKKRSRLKMWLWVIGVIVTLLLLVVAGFVGWYNMQLQPVSANNTNKERVTIVAGSSPSQIGQLLEEKKLIRSSTVFDFYTRLTGVQAALQAGTYSLSPSESTPQIVKHLTTGKVDEFSITFLPGATLAQNRAALVKAGYSEGEVDKALAKTYTSPLFQDKPADADLEGYIYGETYNFDSSATVEDILTKTFNEFYAEIKKNNLIEEFKKQNLTLYQGITLASIIQREVPHAADQKQVAQIFLKRYEIGMPLGSDVTYQYAAKKLGVTPSPYLDSPYNTRKVTGLPPGPIATPGVTALEAVAHPASGSYLYFLSGDDDVTYYATTDAEHEANIRDHCKVKCSLP